MSTEEEFKMVIVVRNDLKMGKGKIAAQVAHASVNCAFSSKKSKPAKFSKWYDNGQRKVVLKVDSLEELYRLKSVADANGITNSVIADQGRTQIEAGSVTCLGLGPDSDSVLDKLICELKLL